MLIAMGPFFIIMGVLVIAGAGNAVNLTDGLDGLSAYRIIAAQAQGFLTENGRVMVEIGWQQGQAVCDIFHRSGWAQVDLAEDLDGRPRVVCAGQPA